MATSKILFDGVGIDLTGDTIGNGDTAKARVLNGYTFHDNAGNVLTGSAPASTMNTFKIRLRSVDAKKEFYFWVCTTLASPGSDLALALSLLTSSSTVIARLEFDHPDAWDEGENYPKKLAVLNDAKKRPYFSYDSYTITLSNCYYMRRDDPYVCSQRDHEMKKGTFTIARSGAYASTETW